MNQKFRLPPPAAILKATFFVLTFLTLTHTAPILGARQTCADVTVVFARGTGEAPPIGSVVGPPFRTALQRAIGGKSLNFVGVDYPASIAGFLEGGDPDGARTMANDVNSLASSCPNTEIVISGYSQGAQVTHLAADQLSSAVQNRVSAAVVFGDPDNGDGFPGVLNDRSTTFCNRGDNICAGGNLVLLPHLTYGTDAPAAAAFVASQI